MNTEELSAPERFVCVANISLGGLIGLLISFPILPLVGSGSGLVMPLSLASFVAGVAVGFRRRRSRAFLYFALVAVLILCSLVVRSMIGEWA